MDDRIAFFRPVQNEGSVWAEESWTAHTGQNIPVSELGQFGEDLKYVIPTCQYLDGIHIQTGNHCPHNNIDDPESDPGWTVLSN